MTPEAETVRDGRVLAQRIIDYFGSKRPEAQMDADRDLFDMATALLARVAS